jgi:inhibitor of cysteine peptidase
MTIEFTTGDRLINVWVGDQFVIALASNPTTGYTWEADFDPALVKLIDDQFSVTVPGIGSGGTQRLRFKTLTAGDGILRVEKKRSWQTTPVEEIVFRLHVSI